MDSNVEGMLFLNDVARIRKYYRTLAPEAEEQFSAESGRWPENQAWPALQHGTIRRLPYYHRTLVRSE